MQNIEINTTQNVRITYEVAHLGDRSLAFLIDLLIIGGIFLGAMAVSYTLFSNATSWLFYLIGVPLSMFYTFGSEVMLKGQTLGKRALNIQVVKLNGTEARLGDYFLRWLFRVIDIYLCVGTVAAIFIVASKKSQRLGDLVSETSIIRVKPSSVMTLLDFQKRFILQDGYVPKFLQVKRMSEDEMLFVQSVILRFQKNKNSAHSLVVQELCSKIQNRLEISNDEVGPDQVKFLSLLIKDYIFLTR